MRVIIGIGNPGSKYALTRHNAGMLLIEYLRKANKLTDTHYEISDEFMNSSGVFVRETFDYYKIELDELYIAHDDLDLLLGEFKIQKGIGPKLHNGIDSINHALSNTNYWRIRIGVDNRDPENRTPGEAYVLQRFNNDELDILDNVFEQIAKDLM